jgi:protein SCO1/2
MSGPDHEPNPAQRKARGRWTTIALAAAAGLAIGGGAYALRSNMNSGAPTLTAQPAIGGTFQLVDQDGRPTSEAALRGKWSAVFFGYTSCPDFCPATLQTLQSAAEQLGPDGRALQVVLITVDPERDTPAVLKSYLEGYAFPGGVRGLTGTTEQVEAATKAWRAYRRKVPAEGAHAGHGGYLMDHSTVVYLTNPQGEFVQVLAHGVEPAEAARQIRAAMEA